MDILVEWRSGERNVVSANELKLVRKGDKFKKGVGVKMCYSNRWYYGTVIDLEYINAYQKIREEGAKKNKEMQVIPVPTKTDKNDQHESDSDNVPLAVLNSRKGEDKNGKATLDLAEVTMGSDSEDSINLATLRNSILENKKDVLRNFEITGIHNGSPMSKKDVQVDFRENTSAICSNSMKDAIESKDTTQMVFSDITSDDSAKDMTYVEECKLKHCNKNGTAFCACGYWLCSQHCVDKSNICHDHELENSDSDTVIIRKLPKKKKKVLAEMIQNMQNDDRLNQDSLERSAEKIPENYLVEGAFKEAEGKTQRPSTSKEIKRKRHSGQDYTIPKTMNLVPPKQIGERCNTTYCVKHNKKCSIVTDDKRKEILEGFYALGKLELQREFICRHVAVKDCKHKKNDSRRNQTLSYNLTLNGMLTPVCKRLFLSTIAISEKLVRTSLLKCLPTGCIEKEKRGGRRESLKLRDDQIKSDMRSHILRFPKVESHYCRNKSSREYLSSELNVVKMYEMYKQEAIENAKEMNMIGSLCLYRKIFDSMNLSFHHPKKDQCTLCMQVHQTAENDIAENVKREFELHSANKNKNVNAPAKSTILRLVNKFVKSGDVREQRSGRKFVATAEDTNL
nr:unnamed protein product [Callosobruchus analis]